MSSATKTILLIMGDILVLYISLFLTLLIRYRSLQNAPLLREHLAPFSILFALWIIVFFVHNLYSLTAAKNSLEFYSGVLRALVTSFFLGVLIFYFVPFFAIAPKRNLFLFFVLFLLLFSAWRQLINRLMRQRWRVATVLMGLSEEVIPLAKLLERNPQIGYRVLGIFTEKMEKVQDSFAFYGRGDLERLRELTRAHQVQTVIVEKHILENEHIVQALDSLIEENVAVLNAEEFKERLTRKVDLRRVDEQWFLHHVAKGRRVTYDTLKRIVDILAVLIFTVPAFVLSIPIALLIKFQDKGPIFFYQERTGRFERPFTLIKFRSMVVGADQKGAQFTIENDPRITSVGKFIRKARLDELPQFINILRGEMSFVGPRSEQRTFDEGFVQHLPFYSRRYLMKPGLTGWAQINYPAVITLDDAKERMAYDFFYLKNRSLIFDIGIILRTLDLIIRGKGR